jgi:hypothetical protein
LYKTFVLLKHSTTAQVFLAICLLIIWNVSLADLHNFWQNLTFSSCSNCNILDFLCLQTTTLHNSDILFEYTAFMQLLLAGRREKRILYHLVIPRIHCST